MRGRIEPRLPLVGRIRLGTSTEEVSRRSGKTFRRPHTSEHLIFTSESRGTLSRLAQLVGGSVAEWPDGQEPWRLVSAVCSLAVQMPPQMLSDPVYELWSAAGCLRRCDGEVAEVPEETPAGPVIVSVPCLCGETPECKVTARVSVVIPQVPGLGVWMVTTHSEIAARELAGQKRLLDLGGISGLIPVTIAIEHERVRRGGLVPVLRLRFHQGLQELTGAAATAGALGAGA